MNSSTEFVVFDVAAEYAHFRRPYAITTALTFPIPTRTALCGLIGVVLGLPKNAGLNDMTDAKALIGLQLLRPVRLSHLSLNLIDTKDNPSFRLKAENPHTIMRYEIILDPIYRIFFAHSDLGADLEEKLRRGESVYTPCCGLAWMIATLDSEPRRFGGEAIGGATQTVESLTPVRTRTLLGGVDWNHDGVYQRLHLPAEMRPDREVTRYEEYLIDVTGLPIRARLSEYWQLDDGSTISLL